MSQTTPTPGPDDPQQPAGGDPQQPQGGYPQGSGQHGHAQQPGYGYQQGPQPGYGHQQGPQYAGGYQPGGYPPAYAPVGPPNNTMAVVSMIAGICGLTVVPMIGSIVALITGHNARREIARTGEAGSGMATAGIVTGWVGIAFGALTALFFVVAFVLSFTAASTGY